MNSKPQNLLPFPTMPKQPKAKAPQFTPPNIDDVVTYAKSIELPGDEAMKFYDRGVAIGWKVGHHAMKDWQAALRLWRRNWASWQAERQPMQPHQQVSRPTPAFAQIKSLEELISKSKANHNSAYYRPDHGEAEAMKLKGWRTRLRELHEQQANGGGKCG